MSWVRSVRSPEDSRRVFVFDADYSKNCLMNNEVLYLLLFAVMLCKCTEGYKILVVFSFPGKSHSILGDGIVKLLADAGHEVTYVTAFPHEKPDPRVIEVDVSCNKELLPADKLNIKAVLDEEIDTQSISNFLGIMLEVGSKSLEHEAVQQIMREQNFDVVIADWMYSDLYAGLGAVFQCPFIWVCTVEPHWMMLKRIDEVPNPAYNSDPMSGNQPPFSFKQRVQELVFQVFGEGLHYFYQSGVEQDNYLKVLAPIIRQRGHHVPSFDEQKYNASLVLGNSHVSIGRATRLPPNYKSVGGYHIDADVKPLPGDLQKLMDNAKHGVIYFSMGTILQAKLMPEVLKKNLLKMFASVKQTVIWKFEENILDRSSNVHIVKWAPQQSILAHPNCILFITHGGLLSITEAIFFGKPVVVIPVFADQFGNADRAVNKGIAKKVDLSYDMAEEIKRAIEEMISDSRYSSRAKELSVVFHDRPVSPGKELVHWVEHVVRTNGAAHLRSLAIDLPLFQKLYLDLLAVIIVTLYLIKIAIKKIFAVVFGRKKSKLDIKKKK